MAVMQHLIVMLVTLGVLIAFHEYGHFWVARRCGVKVLRFSIGFGPVLWRFYDRHNTEFAISALPLGGYVKMLDEREGEVPEDLRRYAFNRQSVYRRMAIVSAGPLANFLLAVIVYWLVFLPGTTGLLPQIMAVEPGSPAAESGLSADHVITAVDDQPTTTVRDVALALTRRMGDSGEIVIHAARSGSDISRPYPLVVQDWLSERADRVDVFKELGLSFFQPLTDPVVAQVLPQSAADQAGLAAGDRLLQADQLVIENWRQWVDYVRERPGQIIQLTVSRDGQTLTMPVTPERVRQNGQWIGQVGVRVKAADIPEERLTRKDYSVFSAWLPAFENTGAMIGFTLTSLKKMLFGDISWRQLSGPISIAEIATESAGSGIYSYLSLLALLSVSLGVLNLLPVPVLDGGHLLFYLIEWVKGSPVPERAQIIAYQLGMALVLSVMMLAIVNDLSRL